MNAIERDKFIRFVNASKADAPDHRIAELITLRRLGGRLVGVGRTAAGDVIVAEAWDGNRAVSTCLAPIDDRRRIEEIVRMLLLGYGNEMPGVLAECDRLGWHAPGGEDA